MISISGHKICGPKGIGALVTRRRRYRRLPLVPLLWGGGQEWGLRPGTLPVFLVAGFGKASQLAVKNREIRERAYLEIGAQVKQLIRNYDVSPVGNDQLRLPCFLNLVFEGMDSEAVVLMLKEEMSLSNGSACTSSSYERSHVLEAMGLEPSVSSVRITWSHLNAL